MRQWITRVIAVIAALVVFPIVRVYAVEAPSLSGNYLGFDAVSLWWSQVPQATYQIWYGPSDNQYAHAAAVGQGTSFTVQSLFRSTSYVFRVKALRDGQEAVSNAVWASVGASGRMPETAGTTVFQPSPSFTPVTSAQYQGNGAVSVWWSQVPGATGYQLWYGPTDNQYAHWVPLPASSMAYTVGELFRDTTYVFRVKAMVDSTWYVSNAVSVWVDWSGRAPVPGPMPQQVTLQPSYSASLWGRYMGGDAVSLWWNSVPDATYQIWYGPKDNPYAHNVVLDKNSTSFTVQALFANTSYVFSIKALVNGTVVAQSNWVSAWVDASGRPR